ncbi:MAG: SUMF1/EgtB/PvdO family nonheme iron enzyme, partial [Planctomycetota bacterium]
MANIIISYNRQNEDIARILTGDIEKLGHDVWFDQELSGGQIWWDHILERVRNCDIFVFVLDPESLDSTACKREYGYAADLGKPILPVLVAEGVSINLLPPALSQIQFVDYRKQDRNAALQLARAITAIPPAKGLPDPLPAPPEAPISYLGNLTKQIETTSDLSYEKQSALVVDLKRSLRNPEAADDARTLLKKLRKRRDLFAAIAEEIDELLASTRKASSVESESQVTQPPTEQPAPTEPLVHEKQAAQEFEESIPDESDHSKPTHLETKKVPSMSQKTKVLAAICIVTFISIILTVVFLKYLQPKTYSLTATAVDGYVTKSLDQASYNHGETVSLEAVPNPGYSFTNWSGDLSGSSNPAMLIMDADKSVNASFALKTYSLTATAVDGSVTRSPDQTNYNHGETVTLEAVPNPGYSFMNWSGDLSGSTNPATLMMDAYKSVSASFAIKAGNVTTNSIGMKLVYIPTGSFMMGSNESAVELAREYNDKEEYYTDEFPQHQVRITEGFWMGQTEVTQGQYKSVMNAQPWSREDKVQEDANNPAVYVTWDAIAEFCRKLSQQEGKTYRLPTEAEWEYAC